MVFVRNVSRLASKPNGIIGRCCIPSASNSSSVSYCVSSSSPHSSVSSSNSGMTINASSNLIHFNDTWSMSTLKSTIPVISKRNIHSSPLAFDDTQNQTAQEEQHVVEGSSPVDTKGETEDHTTNEEIEANSFNEGGIKRSAYSDFYPRVPAESIEAKIDELMANKAPITDFEPLFKELRLNRYFTSAFTKLKQLRANGYVPSHEIYTWVATSGRRTLRPRELKILFGDTSNMFDSKVLGPAPPGLEEIEGQSYLRSTNSSMYFQDYKELLDMMKEDDRSFTMYFYDNLAHHCAGENFGGVLVNVAIALEKRGIQPSTIFYNKMLRCLPACNMMDRANVLFSRMVLNGLADESSYAIRIASLVHHNRIQDAIETFKEHRKLFPINRLTCNTMINGYLKARLVNEALELFEDMKNSVEARPDNITANTFVNYYNESGDLSSASKILDYFVGSNYPSTGVDYGNLIRLYARYDDNRLRAIMAKVLTIDSLGSAQTTVGGGSVTPSGATIKQVIPPHADVEVYNALLRCLFDRFIPTISKQSIGDILNRTLHTVLPVNNLTPLQEDTLKILDEIISIVSPCITSDIMRILTRMKAEYVIPSATTYELLMRTMRFRNQMDGIIKLWKFMTLNCPHVIYSSHRNYHLAALISKGDVEGAQEAVKMMEYKKCIVLDYNLEGLDRLGIFYSGFNRYNKRFNSPGLTNSNGTQAQFQQQGRLGSQSPNVSNNYNGRRGAMMRGGSSSYAEGGSTSPFRKNNFPSTSKSTVDGPESQFEDYTRDLESSDQAAKW